MTKTSVMWFRRDLRLADNTALSAAVANSDHLALVFIIDPEQIASNGSVNQSAFFASVSHFNSVLKAKNISLHILSGNVTTVFTALKKELPDWQDLYFNFDERGYGRKRDQAIATYCRDELQVTPHPFLDFTLHSAFDIKKQDGTGYKVFTPYFKQWIQRPKKSANYDLKHSEVVKKQRELSCNEATAELKKLIRPCDSYAYENQIGEVLAKQVLIDFVSHKLADYDKNRDIPSLDATSHLSRYLRTGEISIRTVFDAVRQEPESDGRTTFIKELCWRDYYNMIYAMYPDQQEKAIKTSFQNVVWQNNEDHFKAWQSGRTGFPIVDAAMRQLNETGWMHNRLRMVVASFLTKDLLIDWRWGEKYFREKLVDYDPASNIGGWQWAASTGTDSVPYFRVFNPTIQSEKFDPDGTFIMQYVPELKSIKSKKIHQPNQLTDAEQKTYGVKLNDDYPQPIVDHKAARLRAIAVYEQSKDYIS